MRVLRGTLTTAHPGHEGHEQAAAPAQLWSMDGPLSEGMTED